MAGKQLATGDAKTNVAVIKLTDAIIVFAESRLDAVLLDEGPDGVFGTFTLATTDSLNPVRANL